MRYIEAAQCLKKEKLKTGNKYMILFYRKKVRLMQGKERRPKPRQKEEKTKSLFADTNKNTLAQII